MHDKAATQFALKPLAAAVTTALQAHWQECVADPSCWDLDDSVEIPDYLLRLLSESVAAEIAHFEQGGEGTVFSESLLDSDFGP